MSGTFNFDDKPTEAITNNPSLELNRLEAKKVIETKSKLLPKGMLMYITGNCFGISYKHPINAPGYKTAEHINMNQSFDSFIKQANFTCNYFYKMAKKMQKRYNPLSSLTEKNI